MGLFRTAARTAVASSVHGRVQRRQTARWSAPHPEPAAAPPPPAVAAPPRAGDQLSMLQTLGELRAAGVLTEQEFQAKKAEILGG